MPSPRTNVDAFLDEAAHPRRAEIDAVRRLVAAACVAVPDPTFIEEHRAALAELVAAWIVAARQASGPLGST